MTARVQCPYCLKRVRLKAGDVMYVHTIGNRVTLRRCPGSEKTKEQATLEKRQARGDLPSGRPDSIEPEDIF